MRKKLISTIFIALFLILSLIPSVGMLVQGETKASANETLASAPRVLNADGKLNVQVLKETSRYIDDRFALRKQLVTAWACLNAKVFHTSAEEQVILGSDGWLYYTPTVDDYMGRSLTEEDLQRIGENLSAMQGYAEANGMRFLFTVAPNKNSLYAAHMPRSIAQAHEQANINRLLPVLEEYGVRYVDLFSAFAGAGDCYYYKTDSHWNDRGAALAADALLSAAGKEEKYFDGSFVPGEGHLGDLYEMLYPLGRDREENVVYAPGFSFTTDGDPRCGEALKIRTRCEGAEDKLFCWRDSFGISLYPYLANSYAEAFFSRSVSYDFDQVNSFGADTVILEIVERNLPNLAQMSFVTPD